MVLKLVVTAGKNAGKEIPVRNNQFVIGRDSSCHLRPNSPAVSKLHCAIVVADEGVWLRDLKSTNGTFLNGQRVADRAPLKNGDKIMVGPLALEVRMPPAAPTAKALPERVEAAKPSITKPAPSKRKETVDDEDVFEWLSEDEEAQENDSDSNAEVAYLDQTLADVLPESETLAEIPDKAPPKPASAEEGTSAAANRLIKGHSFKKRA